MSWETFPAKNTALSSTPAPTPIARLCCQMVTTTVVSMTKLVGFGWRARFLKEPQLKVPTATMIMIATSAGIGIWLTHGPRTTQRIMSTTPAMSVERRVRPPDFTLITDWPIIAQPAMPPKKPVMKFAMPWPRASRFLSLGVSVS